MQRKPSRLFFDANDYKLLDIVNDVLKQRSRPQSVRSLMTPYMHPHGIKEMAAPSGLRIAYAIVCLLGSLEAGMAPDRIVALRSLRDEVFSSSTSYYHKNTARLLMQIMKELVRSQGNELRQLELAHDFRMVYTGKPRLVRKELDKYHLLEMPEEWNQFAFDDHVHDANTKGRKSPTHLLMDAWIKGIRKLTVVYYNHVEQEVVEELLEAGAILDIHVRIGIELSSRFRNKFIRLIWELEGFFDNHSLLRFLQEDTVREIMAEGRQVSQYQQRYVLAVVDEFNKTHRPVLDRELNLVSQPIEREAFLGFVGTGQPSLLHLAKFIQNHYHALLDAEVRRIHAGHLESGDREELLQACARKMAALDLETIIDRFLQPFRNSGLHNPSVPHDEGVPPLMNLSPPDLLHRLASMHSGSRFTLNLSNLSIQDTLELLFICKGRITHIESFNLKDSAHGMTALASVKDSGFAGEAVDISSPARNYQLINVLQKALNEDNVIALKRAIRAIIWDFERTRLIVEKKFEEGREKSAGQEALGKLQAELSEMNERKERLLDILLNIEAFHNQYNKRYLGSRIGSGSTGQSQQQHGMGLVVLDTLPQRAIRRVMHEQYRERRKLIPVTARMIHHRHARGGSNPVSPPWHKRLLAHLLGGRRNGAVQWEDWSLDRFEVHPGRDGNIATLGGIRRVPSVEIHPGLRNARKKIKHPFRYLNTNLRNTLKIAAGFIPAFLTFALTKDWWVLAYLGAFIWFGITGIRNIIQSILGGGGLRRSPLLPWNSLVSWSRIADSLFYTGFSVPLLDYLVKTLLLQQQLGVTTSTSPLLLYSVMALANGIYISTHNILRGLPRSAAIGNFFRSILSIPLAILFNDGLASMLHLAVVPGVEEGLQKWAAVISKLASDCVAAVIEGLADRQNNVRIRLADYRVKLSQVFSAFARLDVLFPEEDVLDLLQAPKTLIAAIHEEARDLEQVFVVNALDLMYIWMYQPRARKALEQIVQAMSSEEWLIFYRSQLVLKRQREISQVFVDGMVGRNFAKALSFYLDRSDAYLLDMMEMGMIREKFQKKHGLMPTA